MTILSTITVEQACELSSALFGAALCAAPMGREPKLAINGVCTTLGAVVGVVYKDLFSLSERPGVRQAMLARACGMAHTRLYGDEFGRLVMRRMTQVQWPEREPNAIVFEGDEREEGAGSLVVWLLGSCGPDGLDCYATRSDMAPAAQVEAIKASLYNVHYQPRPQRT